MLKVIQLPKPTLRAGAVPSGRAIAMNPTSEDTYRVLSVLTRTPGTLKSMLEGLPSSWTVGNEGPETVGPWKPYLPVLTR
jgi:hypothetical protein